MPGGASTGTACCLEKGGRGFGEGVPTQCYAALTAPAKLIVVGLMLVGRLELYTILVLFCLFRSR